MLYFTGTAINVQSLLGVVFVVGIIVANTVLMTDFAQNLRKDEDLSPTEAIAKAAELRVRPVVMTAPGGGLRVDPDGIGAGTGQ